ncbi:MAG TPA: M15 family metallopeptidase [Ornithinibacter sp.]|nr:M15 family metallopeptidase [Ornithinibacter sp.]
MRPRPSSWPGGGPRRPTRLPVALVVALAVALAGLLAALAAPRILGPGTADTAGSETTTAGSATRTQTTAAPPAPTPTPTSTPTARAAGTLPSVDRLTADDPYALSVAASRRTVTGGGPTRVVYLVADAALDLGWAAVPAAAAGDGGVLLTASDRLPEVTTTELQRLDPTAIVLVGGAAVVSDAVATAAASLAPRIVRVDHTNPADAAREITRSAFPAATEVWVASASRPAELATASAVAAGRGAPLLVISEDAAAPAPSDLALVRALGPDTVTLVGDDTSLAPGVEQSLRAALPAATVARIGSTGDSPAATAHTRAWDGAPAGAAFVANPGHGTDAFTGAVLAGGAGAPLLWSLPYCLPTPTRDAVLAPTVAQVTVIGGERSARRTVDGLEPCRSITDPTSTWVLVNKQNPLSPKGFEPSDLTVPDMQHADGHRLRADAAQALADMAAASVEAGVGRIGIDTAYRSFETQQALYDRFLARRGREWTDRWYLRAGFSEHQTGLTVDLLPIGRSNCTINDCIDETPQGEWLAESSWRFGYVLRYGKGQTSVTGVGFEPWHFRYVGTSLARAYHEGGWRTYEHFLGQPAAPTY